MSRLRNLTIAGTKPRSPGQALALFALFLVVLLGAAALAVDYANWLLIDRRLQNVADHAALAGASIWDTRQTQATCSSGGGVAECQNARAQAWKSISIDLGLGLDDATITCLAGADTPVGGWTSVADASCGAGAFGHRIWVDTPPPDNAAYTGVGGRYADNFSVVFARVDEPTRTFLGSVFGITVRDRIGWATAGALPTDFAMQTFCQNNVAPQSGVCANAAGLTIDGQGGIRLIRGDIASNETLKVTAQTGSGVIVESGNAFVVNGVCGSSLWNCPNSPPQGGISDGNIAKNAFYMPPQPVPHYASPLSDVTVTDKDCTAADSSHLCVPYRPWASGTVTAPGDWSCDDPISNPSSLNPCGTPCDAASTSICDAPTSGTIRCQATIAGTPSPHLLPNADLSISTINGTPLNGNNQKYKNIDDDPTVPDADTNTTPANPPTDYVYLQNNLSGTSGSNRSFEIGLRPPFGIPRTGLTTIRFVAFKTNGSALDNTGNAVNLQVALRQNGTTIDTSSTLSLTGTPTRYSFTASNITNFNALSLQFTFITPAGQSNSNANKRAGGISWAEVQTQDLDPALPPMIPPGYYHSITVPDGGCAILDPTAVYSGMKLYQKAGIYRFGNNSTATIDIGAGSFLIGDGVTFVFDPNFPNPTGGRGLIVGAGGGLILNTARTPGTPPCTPSETETTTYNPSDPLIYDTSQATRALPYSSVCAAWAVDASSNTGIHPGTMLWTGVDPISGSTVPYCADSSLAQCIDRSRYGINGLPTSYRGITFYFSTNNWPATTIRSRFQLSGSSGSLPGLAFRGVLYAPYDDVQMSGSNGFNTVGQVLSWTAKFNGGSAFIDLDYPYDFTPTKPYLLEPTIGQ